MDAQYLLFEKYILGELSEKEITQLEYKLAADNVFKEDFNLYKKTSSFLDNKFSNTSENVSFKNNLEKISSTYFEIKTPKQRKKISPWHYSMAASLLLIFSVYFYAENDTATYNDFVNYETIELVTRGTENTLFIKAETAFNAKEFNEAIKYFSEILEKNPTNIEVKIYNAFALLETNQFNKANASLQQIMQGTSVYKNQAIWYLALSKLKQKQYDACKTVLKTIPEDASEYNKAQKLLSKLD